MMFHINSLQELKQALSNLKDKSEVELRTNPLGSHAYRFAAGERHALIQAIEFVGAFEHSQFGKLTADQAGEALSYELVVVWKKCFQGSDAEPTVYRFESHKLALAARAEVRTLPNVLSVKLFSRYEVRIGSLTPA